MAETCETCYLVHAPAQIPDSLTDAMEKRWIETRACLEAQATAMRFLLQKAGRKGTCEGCGKTIYFVRHTNGSNTPYTEAGLNHFVDCAQRDRFRRAR